jgi:hypothetical protein
MAFFRKMADTLSSLAESDFDEKLQLLQKINELIKEGKSVELMHAAAPSEHITHVEQILVLDPIPVVEEVNNNSTKENTVNNIYIYIFFLLQINMWFYVQLLAPSWNALHLPAAHQKRGRPRNNNGYFTPEIGGK